MDADLTRRLEMLYRRRQLVNRLIRDWEKYRELTEGSDEAPPLRRRCRVKGTGPRHR